MNDIEEVLRRDAELWRTAVDSGARPVTARNARAASRRPLLAASVVLLVAVIGAALFAVMPGRRTHHDAGQPNHPPSGAISVLRRYTWSDPHSVGTVIFGEKTMNIYTGCLNGLHQLTVHHHTLTIGRSVGQQSTCGGSPGGVPTSEQKFDRVMRGQLSWSIADNQLVLSQANGASVTLTRTNTSAPSITDTHWTLNRVEDRAGREVAGPFTSATLYIHDGQLRANDLCNAITADITTTATTLQFRHVASTDRGCPHTAQTPARNLIDDTLNGRRTYQIYRAQQLIITGRSASLLIYLPSP